jgi:lipopolysaccharide export system permease protein
MSVTVIPLWLTIAVPIGAFIGVTWVFHRAVADRELLVMQASGMSALQLARAPIALGILLSTALMLNSTILLPMSFGVYKQVQFKVRNSIPTIMLQDDVFIDVVDGMTLLIGEKYDDGLARDIFIHDERTDGKIITLTARAGQFIERDGLPAVLLQDGERMELGGDDEAGAKLLFDTHMVMIASQGRKEARRMPIDMNEDTITNLLDPAKSPSPAYVNQRRAEGHYRLVSPILALVLVLTACCGVLCGQVRRHTWTRRTVMTFCTGMVCIAALISARSLVTMIPATAPLLYASIAVPGILMMAILAIPSLNGTPSNPEGRLEALS